MATKGKIFVFINQKDVVAAAREKWVSVTAIAEDGHVLAGHVCSHPAFADHDMGIEGTWKHDKYDAHYPDGWELVRVPDAERDTHEGFQAAMKANAALATAGKPNDPR